MSIAESVIQLKQDFDDVYEAGKKAEYDAFWDSFQKNGERTGYNNAFQGTYWTEENFKPKYDIKPTSNNLMFSSSSLTNLKGILEECGVKLDFSVATSIGYPFQYAQITHLGVMDCSNATNCNSLLQSASKMISIDKLILKSDGSQTFHNTNSFGYMSELEHMIIEGTIGQPNFNMQWSTKLDKESIISIINALSATTTGLTVTLSKTAVNNAFGIKIDDETTWTDEWIALRDSKSNWTFSFV